MTKSLFFLPLLFLFLTPNLPAQQKQSDSLTLNLTDEHPVIIYSINKNLLLRVVKESSVKQKDFGWNVEVVRTPYRKNSRNLLYHSQRTLGAYPSQVFAWHVVERHFPNLREIEVTGFPIKVKIELIDPQVEGKDLDRRFIGGELRISWGRN